MRFCLISSDIPTAQCFENIILSFCQNAIDIPAPQPNKKLFPFARYFTPKTPPILSILSEMFYFPFVGDAKDAVCTNLPTKKSTQDYVQSVEACLCYANCNQFFCF